MSFLLWGDLKVSCVTCGVGARLPYESQLKELWGGFSRLGGVRPGSQKEHILWLVSYLHRVMCFFEGDVGFLFT